MLGSAVQNLIALTDSVFLYHKSEADFATIGFVGVFYLVVAAIGYGFSKGGQIMIARRMGEGNPDQVGRTFYAMLYFELGLAIVLFLFMHYGCGWFFRLFLNTEIIYQKSLEYLTYRSWGVFFSYIGVAIIALYTGVARTVFIMVDVLVLAIVNGILNYALIFGKWGLPEMGIGGAGLASTIAEIVAFVVFLLYMVFDKKARPYRLFKMPDIDFELIKQQYKLGTPSVAQAIVGLGSWFLFFGIVENMGERELAISNLVRMVYLVLSIPTWGFAAGVNTLVSGFIGADRRQAVFPMVWKTAKLCWGVTMILAIPFVIFPETVLYPLLGSSDMSLFEEARPLFYLLLLILTFFAIGGVFFNGLTGTGATWFGLKMQIICAVGYLLFIYWVVEYAHLGLLWAWSAEIFYWFLMLTLTIWYLSGRKWYYLKV
ncbi:MAG: MATE family efflux transporter [Bacteroidetes bacterium]|nr:MAG: MATE family efflux transporter [Bacteroidota bacterium]